MSKITGHGCDVVDGSATASIALSFPDTAGSDPAPSVVDTSTDTTPRVDTGHNGESEVLLLRPTIWGVGIDLKEAYRRLRRRWA